MEHTADLFCFLVDGIDDRTFDQGTYLFRRVVEFIKAIQESDPHDALDEHVDLDHMRTLHCECSFDKNALWGEPPTWKLYQKNKYSENTREIFCNSHHMPLETFHKFIARNIPAQTDFY